MLKADNEISSELHRHHRRLPHWQSGGSSYFVTFRSAIGELPSEALEIVKHHILFDHKRKYELIFGVVMPDHVHILFRPICKDNGNWYSLQEILKGIKGVSARNINKLLLRTGSVWQDEYFDRLIRDEKELHEKWKYIWENPLKKGLSNSFDDYLFYIVPEENP